jgi:murein DD-endopeptidase MepM/ murein hydrolase activator NlpD
MLILVNAMHADNSLDVAGQPAAHHAANTQSQQPLTEDNSQQQKGFPEFQFAMHPVNHIPNWGAMRSDAEWNRSYAEFEPDDWVAVPAYDRKTLTTPLRSLVKDTGIDRENIPLVTAKLYYSTRYMAAYDLDADEYSGHHAGVDLKLPIGMPVGAVAGGKVHAAEHDPVRGTYVVVEHRNNEGQFFSVYAHLDTLNVQQGQDVLPGQTLGTVGLSGKTTLPHLHLEVRRGGDSNAPANSFWTAKPVHPLAFIDRYSRRQIARD